MVIPPFKEIVSSLRAIHQDKTNAELSCCVAIEVIEKCSFALCFRQPSQAGRSPIKPTDQIYQDIFADTLRRKEPAWNATLNEYVQAATTRERNAQFILINLIKTVTRSGSSEKPVSQVTSWRTRTIRFGYPRQQNQKSKRLSNATRRRLLLRRKGFVVCNLAQRNNGTKESRGHFFQCHQWRQISYQEIITIDYWGLEPKSADAQWLITARWWRFIRTRWCKSQHDWGNVVNELFLLFKLHAYVNSSYVLHHLENL